MSDRSAEQRAWEVIGYSGDVDVNQIDPDSGEAAAFERALAEIAGLERELERLNGQVAELSKANLAIAAKCVSETKRAESDQLMRDIERAREPYGPDMSITAVHISLLETERDGLRLQVADLERELERLNSQVAEWSKANLAIAAKCVSETKRADQAERELAELARTRE